MNEELMGYGGAVVILGGLALMSMALIVAAAWSLA